jgi:predicted GIY-YIG superfamily endonuclease
MKHVYLLESIRFPRRRYKGLTDDVATRLKRHNDGEVPSTRPYRPWRLVVSLRFEDDTKAAAFEQYLKSGSGHAFAERHFW